MQPIATLDIAQRLKWASTERKDLTIYITMIFIITLARKYTFSALNYLRRKLLKQVESMRSIQPLTAGLALRNPAAFYCHQRWRGALLL
jgi:hypothetical protein